jgi:hypothetical protein
MNASTRQAAAAKFHALGRHCWLLTAVALLALASACVAPQAGPAEGDQAGHTARTTVVWISIDGMGSDYLLRAEAPFLQGLQREGAFSTELVPVFPSLTFPAHVSKATGATVDVHGVTGNSFMDSRDWQRLNYPWDSRLLDAEALWTTATRQGVRVAVHDWVLSHAQRGEHAAAYSGERFDPLLRDWQRLERLLIDWEADLDRPAGQPPLQLLMGYVVGPDKPGHTYGPEAEETMRAMARVDALLQRFHQRALVLWERERQPGDDLYFLFTTDHGMTSAHTLVNLGNLLGLRRNPAVEIVISGPVAQVFLADALDPAARGALISTLRQRVGQHAFASIHAHADLPRHWSYAHPTRTGDYVISLDAGYVFSRRPAGVTAPVSNANGPLGMHGYDPQRYPDMNGLMVLWRHTGSLGGHNLGRVHSLQLHASVAALLDIEPAETALASPAFTRADDRHPQLKHSASRLRTQTLRIRQSIGGLSAD